MGTLTIKVPDVGEGIAEVELVSWAVAEGEPVTRNQIIAEVMTDKATVEVPAPVDGVVAGLTGGIGEILLVGSPLFRLAVDGEGDGAVEAEVADQPAVDATAAEAVAEAVAPTEALTGPAPTAPIPAARAGAPRPEGRRPTATPAVRRRARDGGVDLRTVTGTGPAGRITHQDLDVVFAGGGVGSNGSVHGHGHGHGHGQGTGRAGTASGAGLRPPSGQVVEQPIVGMRRKIAEKMVASTSTIPHITYVEEIDMTALETLRATLNQERADDQPKLTLLPFLVRALVNTVPDFPQMNAHVIEAGPDGGADILRRFDGVHVGIAAQTDAGLVVPVLSHAESETIWSAAGRIVALAEAARTGTAGLDQLTGSTITISSLGSLGGLVSTPVINKPETAVIGVNKMVTAPVWIDGAFVPRQMMNLSSSFDHRVVDGWDAARFIQAIKRLLEQPALLFVDRP